MPAQQWHSLGIITADDGASTRLDSVPKDQFIRFSPHLRDFCSIEMIFVLYVFAGRYKNMPPLRGFPLDFTILFLAATCGLVLWAFALGRMRPIRLDVPVLAIASFCALCLMSVFWSSMDWINLDKLARFLCFTGTSFFVSCMLAQERARRERLLRLILWFSIVILAYYAYCRWFVGEDPLSDPSAPSGRLEGDNYLEYGDHAYTLFVLALSLGVFGSRKQSWTAAVTAGLALFALLAIGGRGPLLFAILAIPLSIAGLCARGGFGRAMLLRLVAFIAVLGVSAVTGYVGLVQLRGPDALTEQLHTVDRYREQLSGEYTRSVDLRIKGQEDAFAKWLQKPLLGWGIGEFGVQHTELRYPHNLLLEILMEMGIVGAFLFCVALVAAATSSVRLLSNAAGWVDNGLALLALTGLLSYLSVEGYLADARESFMYLGLIIGTAGQASRRARRTSVSGIGVRRAEP